MAKNKEETYFTISNSDGDTYVYEATKESLLKELDEGDLSIDEILTEIPESNDTNYWGGKTLIIKGEIVVPKPVTVVEKYELE